MADFCVLMPTCVRVCKHRLACVCMCVYACVVCMRACVCACVHVCVCALWARIATGKLGLFIGNKRQEQLSDFELTLGVQSPDLSCVCSAAGSSIAPRQQMQLTASVIPSLSRSLYPHPTSLSLSLSLYAGVVVDCHAPLQAAHATLTQHMHTHTG